MADNVAITSGSGTTIAADEVVDGTLGTVKVQYVKLMDGTIDGTSKATVGSNGLKVDGSAVTQPISAASLPLPAGASTSAKQPALGTAGTPSADVITVQGATSMTALKVDGSAVTQPISATSLPLPTGAATQATLQSLSTNNFPASISVTATGASGAAVTLTLPAVASAFHYLTFVQIVKYAAVALVGGATPIVVTSTNLPGSPAWTFMTAQAIGTSEIQIVTGARHLQSTTVNTATTIVCPATVSVIWRVNVSYYAV